MNDYEDPRNAENLQDFDELPLRNGYPKKYRTRDNTRDKEIKSDNQKRHELHQGFDPEEVPSLGDTLADRKAGTGDRLFDLKDLKDTIISNCVEAEELSKQTPSERGMKGIQNLLHQSFRALQVSKFSFRHTKKK